MTSTRRCAWIALGLSIFFIFLPTGPIASEIFEIVPVHLRASAMAVCTFMIHPLSATVGSPTAVGHLSTYTNSLQAAVLILPAMLLIGAVLWCILIPFTHAPHEVEA